MNNTITLQHQHKLSHHLDIVALSGESGMATWTDVNPRRFLRKKNIMCLPMMCAYCVYMDFFLPVGRKWNFACRVAFLCSIIDRLIGNVLLSDLLIFSVLGLWKRRFCRLDGLFYFFVWQVVIWWFPIIFFRVFKFSFWEIHAFTKKGSFIVFVTLSFFNFRDGLNLWTRARLETYPTS